MGSPPPKRTTPWLHPRRLRALAALCVVVAAILIVVAFVGASDHHKHKPKGALRQATPSPGRAALTGFDEARVRITSTGGKQVLWCLLRAATARARQRGLMQVRDRQLGHHGGMLFSYPRPSNETYWMRNTPMPLSIAFFDAKGRFVSATDMAPCGSSAKCPSYAAAGPYQYAIEVPQGQLASLGIGNGARIDVVAAGSGVCRRADQPAAA